MPLCKNELLFWGVAVFPTALHSICGGTPPPPYIHIYANSFSASRRRFKSGRDTGFSGNGCEAVLSSQTLPYQALHAKWNENEIENFLNTVGFLLKYSDIKTPASVFDFETCSAHVYSMKSKPFGKSICGGQFRYCNKSMCGNPGLPWIPLNWHWFYSNERVKCLWSDSEQFWWCLCIYVLIIASVMRFSLCSKQTRTPFIHSHRDAQNMQDSYFNQLLRLNIYRYWSIWRFDLINLC